MADVWCGRVRKAMPELCANISKALAGTRLSNKLNERGFIQHERDPCLFMNTELDICIGVHVDDMQAVGPSQLTTNLLQDLSKDMAMRWSMVTDKPREFLGRSSYRPPRGYNFGFV